ncbi:MAG TPA: hypothetical protein ENN51_05655 [candidate division WOR-3 bacterium]|uniref:Uncharacterized protein n=1 Tax=candidate division WOR-3 bacterium TaxID=2052148 RepID=A0A7V0T5V8_UNCW3|nr:hypothetical protein [candidate division WOR-3 bacterium]
MRRFALGLIVFAVAAGMLLTAGCQRDRSFRILSINQGEILLSDLVDFGEIVIREPGGEPERYEISEVPTDIVDMDLQYVEMGLGLPTWTPYLANVERATISYVNLETGETYEAVQVALSAAVQADPEGRRSTRVQIAIAPGQWKASTFEDYLQTAPEDDDYGPVATVKATVTVEGIDYVSTNRVRATKDCLIIFGNFWDEPSRLGQ